MSLRLRSVGSPEPQLPWPETASCKLAVLPSKRRESCTLRLGLYPSRVAFGGCLRNFRVAGVALPLRASTPLNVRPEDPFAVTPTALLLLRIRSIRALLVALSRKRMLLDSALPSDRLGVRANFPRGQGEG